MARRHYRVSVADALAAHDESLRHGGGRPGVSNLSNVQGALGRPFHGYHRSISEKSAALLHGMATSHGFADGNKRTSWIVTFVLIERSGYDLVLLDDDRIDDVVVDVVEGSMNEQELVKWFRARLRALPD
ncbi:type II toxin-antitoxin system death-on-curing family toxin [Abyssibius alkaniclasticus]|uniref:type II toxin-antitoxin system death-on-curing family toxin n=1 Tax=Abyssibius alkaniclasticus TaxID=2881234 RepID=UPI004059C19C